MEKPHSGLFLLLQMEDWKEKTSTKESKKLSSGRCWQRKEIREGSLMKERAKKYVNLYLVTLNEIRLQP
jgi:hypothetical protein